MGRFLADVRQLPDLAMTSPAVRARQTLELAMLAGRWQCSIDVRDGLYGDAAKLLEEIRAEPSPARALLLVGHEPALSMVAQLLTGAAQIRLPTATMLRLEFDARRWRDVEPAAARIMWIVPPRLLASR